MFHFQPLTAINAAHYYNQQPNICKSAASALARQVGYSPSPIEALERKYGRQSKRQKVSKKPAQTDENSQFQAAIVDPISKTTHCNAANDEAKTHPAFACSCEHSFNRADNLLKH